MIDKKTVFIIGAGANKPYGFPTGIELRNMICDSKRFQEILKSFSFTFHKYPFKDIEELMESSSEFSEAFEKASLPKY